MIRILTILLIVCMAVTASAQTGPWPQPGVSPPVAGAVSSNLAAFANSDGTALIDSGISKEYIDSVAANANLLLYMDGSRTNVAFGTTNYYLATNAILSTSNAFTNVVGATITNDQYLYSFAAPVDAISKLEAGKVLNIHWHGARVGNSSTALTAKWEVYVLESSGVATNEIEDGSVVTLTTKVRPRTTTISLSRDLTLPSGSRLALKMKAVSANGSVGAIIVTRGTTAARLEVPTPSGTFVNKGGDTMTGKLIVPELQVTGTLDMNDNPVTNASKVEISIAGTGAQDDFLLSAKDGDGEYIEVARREFSFQPVARIPNGHFGINLQRFYFDAVDGSSQHDTFMAFDGTTWEFQINNQDKLEGGSAYMNLLGTWRSTGTFVASNAIVAMNGVSLESMTGHPPAYATGGRVYCVTNEVYAMDQAGNISILSPHPEFADGQAVIIIEANVYADELTYILKSDLVGIMTGLIEPSPGLLKTIDTPADMKRDWDNDEEARLEQSKAARSKWDQEEADNDKRPPAARERRPPKPKLYVKRSKPVSIN